jgi:hypothetical protein
MFYIIILMISISTRGVQYQMRKEYQSNIKFIPNYYQNNAGVKLLKYFKEAFCYHSIISVENLVL